MLFLAVRFNGKTGDMIYVTVDGNLTATYSLDTNTEVLLGNDEQGNTLVIEDGSAFLRAATCPDKLCVKQGKISLDGQTIVCLPNKTVITVKSSSKPENDFLQ